MGCVGIGIGGYFTFNGVCVCVCVCVFMCKTAVWSGRDCPQFCFIAVAFCISI